MSSNEEPKDLSSQSHSENEFQVMLFVSLFICSLIPAALVFVLFSALGFGAEISTFLSDHSSTSRFLLAIAVVLTLTLYLLDASYWTSTVFVRIRHVSLFLIAAGIAAGVSFTYVSRPYAPLACFFLGVPLFFKYLFPLLTNGESASKSTFLIALSFALLLSGCLSLLIWFIWIASGNWWTDELDRRFSEKLKCEQTENCQAAYLLWISPAMYGGMALVFSAVSSFLGRVVLYQNVADAENEDTKGLRSSMKIFVSMLFMSILGMWIAASISGIELELANVIMTFSSLALVVITGLIVSTIGWKDIKEKMHSVPFLHRVMESFLSDWIKAFVLLFCFPFIFFSLTLSALNQFIRVRFTSTPKKLDYSDKDTASWLTAAVAKKIQTMKSWSWSSILAKMNWIVVFIMIVNVGVGRITTIFLSWLNEQLSTTSLGLTTIIFVLVGLGMFLAPPIPGVPVYISGGIILVANIQDRWGFVLACVYASMICYLLKFCAILMQQVLIGRQLSGFVTVRRFVGVNSITIRSIRQILLQPGIKLDKVAILCGGPDWPTSVLTGILKLSVLQMLIGSLPLIFLVVPCTLAGALLLKSGQSPLYDALGAIALALSALTQAGALLVAMYYIEEYAAKHEKELSAEELDLEVLEFDERSRIMNELYAEVTNWNSNKVPFPMKAILVSSTIIMVGSLYIVQFFGSSCFRPYSLGDTIADKLDGNVLNVVLPLGYAVLGSFVFAYFLFWVFRFWANRERRFEQENQKIDPEILAASKMLSVHNKTRTSLVQDASLPKISSSADPQDIRITSTSYVASALTNL